MALKYFSKSLKPVFYTVNKYERKAIIYLWKDWMLKQNKNNLFRDR